MKYIRKKLIITGVIMVMGLGLTGCTKTDENAETTGGSAVEAEDLPGTKEQGDEEAQTNNSGNVEEPEAEDADKGGQDADSSDNSQKDADISSLYYIPDTKADLCGDICEVGDKQFTVTEIFTDTLEEGGEIMVSSAPGAEGEEEAAKITVIYDENTVFEKQKIWDAGAGHEEKEGSAADLQKGFTAEMWGSYEGNVFHATAIKIVEVILG